MRRQTRVTEEGAQEASGKVASAWSMRGQGQGRWGHPPPQHGGGRVAWDQQIRLSGSGSSARVEFFTLPEGAVRLLTGSAHLTISPAPGSSPPSDTLSPEMHWSPRPTGLSSRAPARPLPFSVNPRRHSPWFLPPAPSRPPDPDCQRRGRSPASSRDISGVMSSSEPPGPPSCTRLDPSRPSWLC